MAPSRAHPLPARPQSAKRRSFLFGRGVVGLGLLVLILGIGLGLGLGLRNLYAAAKSSPPSFPPASSPAPSPVPTPLPGAGATGSKSREPWRLDTGQYVIDMNWDLHAKPSTRYYDLVITEGQGWPDGVVRDMLFINGKFPGPLIEANRGDRLVVNVTNQLKANSTAIHWHGLLQNGTNWFDGTVGVTQCGIPPGHSLVYNFTLDGQYGTYWYHSHMSSQYLDGLIGPLVIHAPEEESVRSLYDRDQVVLIQDWYHDPSPVNIGKYLVPDNENSEPIPDNGLINGANYFNCSLYHPASGRMCYDSNTYSVFSLAPNTRTRLRLINTGAFAEFDISIDNHSLSVIEADGTLVKPHDVHRLPIHVAQRYSIVLNTNQSASTNYWLRGSMITSCFTGDNEVLDPTTKAVISYSGNDTIVPYETSRDWADANPVECTDLNESELVPSLGPKPPPATALHRIDFSFGIGANQMDFSKVNGTTWSPLANTTTLLDVVDGYNGSQRRDIQGNGSVGASQSNQFVVGLSNDAVEVVDVLLYSLDEGAHPFHLHGHQVWILQTGSGPFNWTHYYAEVQSGNSVSNALRRDTFTVKSYEWTLIRLVADNPGLWALHCHIAWHMEAGLLMQFMSRADVIRGMNVPPAVRDLCAA